MIPSFTAVILHAALLLTWLGGQSWCVEAEAQAKPITVNYDIDAGVMYPGELRVVRFLPRVAQEFTVQGVRNSCGCMFTGEVPATVGPTTTKEFAIALKAADSPQDIRLFTWIDVRDERGQAQVLQATITGSIVDPLHWDVSQGLQRGIDLGVASSQAEPSSWSARINHGPHPMPWTRLRAKVLSGESWLEATITTGQDGHHLHLIPRHQVFSGVLHGRIQVFLDDQEGKTLPYQPSYPVKYVIRGSVTPTPAMALVGSMAPGTKESLTVRLRANDGALPAIDKLVSSNPGRLTAEQRDEVIHLHVDGILPGGSFHEHLDIHFITGAIVRVPVIGAVTAVRP